jgi:hypothetical protein
MKKKILALLTVCALMATASVHAQTTVVVKRPGLLSGFVDTAEALLLLPLAVAEGVVVGTAEAADAILNGTTTVYTTTPATVYASPAPVVVSPAPVVAPAPVVVTPAPVQTTTVTRTRTTTVTTVVRPSYEVIVPHRHVVVTPAPVVRYRYR